MAHIARFIAATFVTSLLFCQSLAAQSEQSETSAQRSPWIFSGTGYGVHQDDADLKDSDGSFNVDRWFVNAGVTFAWSKRDMIGVTVGGGKDIYEFDGLGSFGGGQPWGNISDTRLTVLSRTGIGESSVLTIVPTVRVNGESGADTGDSTTYGLFAAVTWRMNPNLTIGPGVGVFTKLEGGTKVFPVLAIDWNITDRWNFSTSSGAGSSQGSGLTLSYKLNEDWSFGLTGRYEDLEFRLDEKGIEPGGIGSDKSLPLLASVKLKPNRYFSVSLFAGAQWMGKLELEDSHGHKIQESDYDPALLVGASIEARF